MEKKSLLFRLLALVATLACSLGANASQSPMQSLSALDEALNYGGSIHFTSGGIYPWTVVSEDGRTFARSGCQGVKYGQSVLNANVTVESSTLLSFEFKACGDNNDDCLFFVDGEIEFRYGASQNGWETYTVQLAAGTHTLAWSYSKDASGNPEGDYFAVDNVAFGNPIKVYALYNSGSKRLSFYRDNQWGSRDGTVYDLNEGSNIPGWFSINSQVTSVVFDPSFDLVRPTSTYYWFSNMQNLVDIFGLNYLHTDAVTNMGNMFSNCKKLTNLDLSSFNTGNVTYMGGMFQSCSTLSSINLSSFNTANVTSMSSMFYNCQNLSNLDLSSFNTANVTDMVMMFSACSTLSSLNLSSFNTANVTDMRGMFYSSYSLSSIDLHSFNTAKVTNMSQMFMYCNGLTTIYVDDCWNTANVTNSSNMFSGATKLVGGQGTAYSSSNPTDKTYAHIDGGPSNPGYFTEWKEAYAVYENKTLTFYYDNQRSFRSGKSYDLNYGSNKPGWCQDYNNMSVTSVVFDPSFADARPTSAYYWFYYMTNLQSISGIEYLNTEEVTNMSNMFSSCYNLISLDLSSFNTANVTDMTNMFKSCEKLKTIYVDGGWNTDNVTNSSGMFRDVWELVGGRGTAYSFSNPTDKTYAHIDGGPSNPGYFTDPNAVVLKPGDVNGDNVVDIDDVSAIIFIILEKNTIDDFPGNADLDGNGTVDVDDMNAVIHIILTQ